VRVAVKIGGFYLKKLFFPWPLNFCIIKVPDYYLGLGCALILIIAYLLYRRDLVSSFFVAGICIGTSALIVAFGNLAWTPIAERYMYIPSAFMVIGTTLMIAPQRRVSKNANATISIVTLLVLVVFAISTTLRNITWQDNLTLFTDTVEKSPDFLPARNDKAIALINKGMNEEGYKIIKSLPTSAGARNWEQTESNKVSVLVSEGKIDEARKVLKPMAEKSWRNQVRSIEALLKIDENLMMDPKRKDTVEIGGEVVGLLETLQKKTGNPFYYYRLGQTYLILKNRAEAQKMFEKAYLYAPATAYYREPAGKLAKKLAELARE
jgi:tetratricopeptide (TPR) repeat protein